MKGNKFMSVSITMSFTPSPLIVIDGHNVIHDNICMQHDMRNCLECQNFPQNDRKYWRLTSEIGRLEKCLKFYRDLGYEPFAWIKQSTYNTAKWYADEMDFAAVLKMIEAKELDIPTPEDDDIWWVTYALKHGGQIVTNDKFKDKYLYEDGKKKRDESGDFILKKKG